MLQYVVLISVLGMCDSDLDYVSFVHEFAWTHTLTVIMIATLCIQPSWPSGSARRPPLMSALFTAEFNSLW